jgi:copper resistance protein C
MLNQTPRRIAGVLSVFVAVLLVSLPRMALAHAVLVSSTPEKNAATRGPDVAISLKYNSRIDAARSTLSLLRPDGSVQKIGTPDQQAPDSLSTALHGLGKGAYILRWQVLAHDGHITRGELPFKVD